MTRQQFAIALVVLAAAGVAGGALSDRLLAGAPAQAQDKLALPEKTVSAEAFQLVDGQGKTRALLALQDGEPVLSLTDSQGHERVTLVASVPEAGLRVLSADGKERAVLGELPDTSAGLTLSDYRGRPRAAMGEAGGTVKLATVDTDGSSRFLLEMKGNADPTVRIMDAQGHTVWPAQGGRGMPGPSGR